MCLHTQTRTPSTSLSSSLKGYFFLRSLLQIQSSSFSSQDKHLICFLSLLAQTGDESAPHSSLKEQLVVFSGHVLHFGAGSFKSIKVLITSWKLRLS